MGGHSKSQTPPTINGIQVTQSSYGNAVPLVYGTTRIPGTLIWYGDFTATPQAGQSGGKGGGGSSGNTQYNYSAALALALCEGPIFGIGAVWANSTPQTLTDLSFTQFDGAGGQAVWSYLTSNYPAQAIPYDHLAYVATSSFNLGSSAGMPNISFEVAGFLLYAGLNDAEPSAIINDYLSSPTHGANFTNIGSLTNYQNYCISLNLFLSVAETTQRNANDFIQEMMDMTNSAALYTTTGLTFIPYCDQTVSGNGHTYAPNMTPLYSFGDGDFCPQVGDDPVVCTRTASSDVYNCIRVEFLDASNYFNTAIAEATDDQDIALRGLYIKQTLSYHSITNGVTARLVAQLILQRQLYVRNTYEFQVRSDYCLLEPMDLVSISDVGLGLSNQLVRITKIEDDENDNLDITAEEVPIGVAHAPIYDWQASAGYAANYDESPGTLNTPVMFCPPSGLTASGGLELWCAVNANSNLWGGCNVYVSMDNTSYVLAQTIFAPSRYGVLTATLPSHADPDTTDTLAIQLNNTSLQLNSGTTSDADNLRILALVDGEIIAYSTATLTGAGAYNITYLRRGAYGTTIASHSSGASFVRLDGSLVKIQLDNGLLGQTIYVKFQSFNIYGGALQEMSSLTAYSQVLTTDFLMDASESMTLIPRGNNSTPEYNVIVKTSGTTAWDSDCYSVQSYTSGCYLTFRAGQINLAFMIGLGTNPTLNQSYTSIDFAFYCDASGVIEIYELGTQVVANAGSYTTSTVFLIKYDGNFVNYFVNGVIVRSVPAPGETFYLDSSFNQVGAQANNIDFGVLSSATPSQFIARGQCVVSDVNFQKIGGSPAWDSDIYSLNGYQQCHVTWKMNANSLLLAIGLGTHPAQDESFTSINYAILCDGSGFLTIYESGSAILSIGTYTVSTVLAITYDGSTVTYWKDGVSRRTVSVSGLTLFMDSSFHDPGSSCNSVIFGPSANIALVDTLQIRPNAATLIQIASASGLTTIGGGGYTTGGPVINFAKAGIYEITISAQMTVNTFISADEITIALSLSGAYTSISGTLFPVYPIINNATQTLTYTVTLNTVGQNSSWQINVEFGNLSVVGNSVTINNITLRDTEVYT